MPRKISYQERKRLGLCVDCSKGAINGQIYCEQCRERHLAGRVAKKKKLALAGLCVMCGSEKEQPDRAKCNACLSKMNDFMANRRQKWGNKSLCLDCGGGVVFGHKRCETCYLKMISVNVFGDVQHHGELRKLFDEQNGLCKYSGKQLRLQENCELDHIVPRSKGGSDSIDNLQWLHRDVNKMKHDLTEADFIEWLQIILDYFDRTSTPESVTATVCSH